MQQLNEHHSFAGMQRDMVISKHPSSLLYDAHNIRLTVREEDTLSAITNERGPKDLNIKVTGNYLGHCLLNSYLVIFSTTGSGAKPDYITRVDLSTKKYDVLYNGALNFSEQHPIEALSSYENERIQKVYWTDGYNSPRLINIAPGPLRQIQQENDSQFDFIGELRLQEKVSIQKQVGTEGQFAPGVIQYAFTYFRKYQQESNIFYTSPLLYISYLDRGASPEDKVANSFKITISDLDTSYDYIRVYSIQRTSINSTPVVKRVSDLPIRISNEPLNEVSFTDTGLIGDSIDPTELLYKGGEQVVAGTMTQKDGTLFLGNLTLSRPHIDSDITRDFDREAEITQGTRAIYMPQEPSTYDLENTYANQLTAYDSEEMTNSVPCGGFKRGDYYRCGVQFQYKTGRWSDPIFIKDQDIINSPSTEVINNKLCVKLTVLSLWLSTNFTNLLKGKGYKRARTVVVFPELQDRVTICQGITCPTLYTEESREAGESYAQSSWFFRPNNERGVLHYTSSYIGWDPVNINKVEIPGEFLPEHKFQIDQDFVTFHSPDLEFDDNLLLLDFYGLCYRKVGGTSTIRISSDIDIQTETPTISNNGKGFTKNYYRTPIRSGLFYSDYLVDDTSSSRFAAFGEEYSPYNWLVYTWQRNGSLTNDINRPAGTGATSSVLKKKVICNLWYTKTDWEQVGEVTSIDNTPQIFSSDQLTIVKVGDCVYQGNIDTLLSSDSPDGNYFAFDADNYNANHINTSPNSSNWWKAFSESNTTALIGLYKWNKDSKLWEKQDAPIGDKNLALVMSKSQVRMRYKSTPHIVLSINGAEVGGGTNSFLPIIEIVRKGDTDESFYREIMFGGDTQEALMSNKWVPCGEPVILGNGIGGTTNLHYSYGDTYYQRWDCLKTYPFSSEDVNQVVEIGSFMLETRVNIDGRCDRNRSQSNNLNMTPQNFNLINTVYSQTNNFFTYRILDEDYYKSDSFSAQITWSKEKQIGADVDNWTNITLASTYDLDGGKGEIVSLKKWNDAIFCFQNTGISEILFNSRVQIPVSDGVPIEISNSYKVGGYRYLRDSIGCSNKWTISNTPSGLYFIDSIHNHLYHIGKEIQDISTAHNMTSWFNNIEENEIVSTLYDNVNHDVYLMFTDKYDSNENLKTSGGALCYSEILGQFTSFMDYDRIALLESDNSHVYTLREGKLYEMFQGEYCNFFGTQKEWNFTFVSNGVDQSAMDYDKIFSTIDYRMDVFDSTGKYRRDKTLDHIQVDNEYQNTGRVNIPYSSSKIRNNPQKKFRTWRIQIPRVKNSLDRIRNQWCKIKLMKSNETQLKAVLHDLNVQYFV